MPKVYAIQNQHFKDRTTGQLVPKVDMEPALAYGELVYIFEPNARSHLMINSLVDQAWDVLTQMQPDDYLVLMGDPVLIGIAFAVASDVLREHGGDVRVLKWSKKFQTYEVVACNPFIELNEHPEL
jgi:hypothetical protein